MSQVTARPTRWFDGRTVTKPGPRGVRGAVCSWWTSRLAAPRSSPGRGLVPNERRDRSALPAVGGHRGRLGRQRQDGADRPSQTSVCLGDRPHRRAELIARIERQGGCGTGPEAPEGREQAQATIGRAGVGDHRVVRQDIGQRDRFVGKPIRRVDGVYPVKVDQSRVEQAQSEPAQADAEAQVDAERTERQLQREV